MNRTKQKKTFSCDVIILLYDDVTDLGKIGPGGPMSRLVRFALFACFLALNSLTFYPYNISVSGSGILYITCLISRNYSSECNVLYIPLARPT